MLKRALSELELSVRSRNCMAELGVQTIGDLVLHLENDLMGCCKNFGQTSMNEIRPKLAEFGLMLRHRGDLGRAGLRRPGRRRGDDEFLSGRLVSRAPTGRWSRPAGSAGACSSPSPPYERLPAKRGPRECSSSTTS